MLYPFWGDIPLPSTDPDIGRFDDYISKGNDIFETVNLIEECDVAVLPFEYDFEPSKAQLASQIANEAKQKGKKLVVFFNSDLITDIKLDNAIVFRTSFFKSNQKTNEFAFPGWSVDFMRTYSVKDSVLSKPSKVKISYCGYVDYLGERKTSFLSRIKSTFSSISKESLEYGSYLRGKIVRSLLTDTHVETDFIIRNGFWAQGIEDKLKVRKEYIENMFNSPYALVTRGAGNFSYRLYEVMSCGRIPVFINTDCVLPLENLIDWKKQMVWIEEPQLNQIGSIVSKFHQSISETHFKDLQIQNRNIYETYLSPAGFFNNLKEVL